MVVQWSPRSRSPSTPRHSNVFDSKDSVVCGTRHECASTTIPGEDSTDTLARMCSASAPGRRMATDGDTQ